MVRIYDQQNNRIVQPHHPPNVNCTEHRQPSKKLFKHTNHPKYEDFSNMRIKNCFKPRAIRGEKVTHLLLEISTRKQTKQSKSSISKSFGQTN